MSDCIFCKIAAGKIPANKIYESDELLAFLDIQPNNPGHTLVIPKKHFTDLLEVPDETLLNVMKIVKKVGAKIIESGLGQGFNTIINTKKTAGQVVNHFHIHIIPRLEGDGYQFWPHKEYAPGQAETIAAKLKLEE